MKRNYTEMLSDSAESGLCVICKRFAYTICAGCQARGLSTGCWVNWDPVTGPRHQHCEFGLPPMLKGTQEAQGKKN